MFRHTLIVFFAVLGLLPRETKAEEFIKSFDAVIQVETSGALEVTETITVHATGDKIRHGIYRDFPFSWVEGDETGFKIVTVERDGRQDAWSRQAISGGTRVYLGTQSQMVPPGDHTYRISYRTDNQVRSHDTYDNLVWNVTGNGWLFPIAQATATVSLPGKAKPEDATVYTGPRGARGKDATAQLSGTTASFAMTRDLSIGEGLTIDIKIPKGVISPPTPTQKSAFWWWDEKTAITGGSVLAIASLILFVLWLLYGKDPAKGSTPLRWTPPEGLSPGVIGYIQDGGFSDSGYTALSASLIDLAAKGYLVIRELDNGAGVKRTEKSPHKLPYDQLMIIQKIERDGGYLELSKENIYGIGLIVESQKKIIDATENAKFKNKNNAVRKAGVAILIASIFASISISNQPISIYSPLIIVSLIIYFVTISTKPLMDTIKGFYKPKSVASRKSVNFTSFIIITPLAIIVLNIFINASKPQESTELVLIYGFLVIASFLVSLMGKAIKRGRDVKDQIEGLRQYLTLSSKRREAINDIPLMSSSHFESLLPYAIVLGVHRPWLRTFEQWQESHADLSASSYSQSWWRDNSFGLTDRDFDISPQHSRPAANQDSSSFGSGFSGSGGGGGGGGGW